MDSFFLLGARPLVEASPSMKLHELLDWGAIAAQLKGLEFPHLTDGKALKNSALGW